MSGNFCPFTKESCRKDCALYFGAMPAEKSMCVFMENRALLKSIEQLIINNTKLRQTS